MGPSSTRLRARLAVMALVALAPAVAAVAYTQAIQRRQAHERTLNQNLRLARLAASKEAGVFEGVHRLLLTLSAFPNLLAAGPDGCTDILSRVLRDHPGYLSLAVRDANGSTFCSVPPGDRTPAPDHQAAWVRQVLQSDRTIVGEFWTGPITGRPSVEVGRRVIGSVSGPRVITASIQLDQLEGITVRAGLPQGTTVTMFDRAGRALAHAPDSRHWNGWRLMDPSRTGRPAGVRENVTEERGADGVQRLYVSVPVEGPVDTGLTLGIAVDHAVAFAEADRLLRQSLWLLGLMSLAVVAGAFGAGELFLVRPMATLSEVSGRLAAGDLSARTRLASGGPGLPELGTAIDAMAIALETREEELRVSEQRYRNLFEQNPQPMWVYDLETLRFLEVNDAAVRRYGYSRDEFLAMTLADIRPAGDVSRLRENVSHHLEDLQQADNWRHRLKSGRVIDVDIVSHSFTYHGRQARIVVAHDITARRRAEQARRLLASIVEDSDDAILGTNFDRTIVGWNAGAEKLYGYTRAEALGQPISIIVPDDRLHEVADLLGRLAAGEHIKSYETIRQRKDGTRVPVSLTLSPIRGERGEIVGAATIARDITERERAEQALRDSEERLRRIAETVTEAFWIADVERDTIVYISPGYERIWGRTCASLYEEPRSFLDAVHPDDRQSVLDELDTEKQGLPFDNEYRILRPDGKIRWIWDRGFPVPNPGGRVVEYIGVAQDITDRVRAKRALLDAEERTRFALQASGAGIWEADLRTGTTYWSETCEAMHGLAPGTFGKTLQAFFDLVHPEDRGGVQQAIEDATRERREAALEYRTTWPNGSVHRIASTGRFSCDEGGAPTRGAGVVVDVTERRSLEDQLRQAQKMEAVGQLAGGIAHDFNNMLTAILGNAEFVLDELPDHHASRVGVEEIMKAAHRSSALTHQLLAFSRKQILAPRVLRVGDVVSEVTPMLRRLLGETIDLRSVLSDGGAVRADAGQLQQVLVNLAVNARDAMPDGGRLTIETRDVTLDDEYARQHPTVHPGPHVMMAVSDTGHGMNQAVRQRIFDPFFTTKPLGQGTGLGLATVYGIVKQSGGHVWVYSEVGHGTTFKVYLPRTQDAVGEAAATRADGIMEGTETILLVEDEDVVRDLVFKLLTRHGYRVHALADPQHAIRFGSAHPGTIDLILTDVVLPTMSGRAMAAALQESHPESRILYTSGYTDSAIVHHGVLDPGMQFIPKPFTADTLLRTVRSALDGQAA